jgi:hypothetical protein
MAPRLGYGVKPVRGLGIPPWQLNDSLMQEDLWIPVLRIAQRKSIENERLRAEAGVERSRYRLALFAESGGMGSLDYQSASRLHVRQLLDQDAMGRRKSNRETG